MNTLLAVDDSNTMRKVMEITFAGEDFKTVLAASSTQAMDQLQQSGATVALVDSALSGENGYELCQRIKGQFPRTRVLLLSSKQHPFDANRGAAAGADDHLDKPFDTQTLIDKVRALARGASLPAQAASAAVPTAAAAVPVVAPVARAVVPQPPAAIPIPIPRSSPMAAAAAPAPVVTAPLPAADAIPAAARAEAQRAVEPARGLSTADEAITIEPKAPAEVPRVAVPQAAPLPSALGAAAPVAAASVGLNGSMAGLEGRLAGLGLTPDQITGVLQLSRDVVEQVVWEVVPMLAETLIKEEIARLTK